MTEDDEEDDGEDDEKTGIGEKKEDKEVKENPQDVEEDTSSDMDSGFGSNGINVNHDESEDGSNGYDMG